MSKMQKIKQNRKGIMTFNFLAMIPRIIFLVVVLIVCVILISIFLNNKFNTVDVQAEILINGFLYGTGGVSYLDPLTGRIYPEVIDLRQLDSTELDSAFYYPDNHMITARIAIEKPDQVLPLKEIYYNKEWWDNWKPLLALKYLPGIGGVIDYEKKFPIYIIDETGDMSSAYVTFQVVQPKSLRKTK